MDVEKRLRLVCNFCNAILLSKKEATKDAFTRHLEESHNIVQNADDVLILHCLSDEDKATLKKKKRASLEDVFGLVIERDEEDVDDQKKIFNYPRLKKNPKEKYSEFVRRKLSVLESPRIWARRSPIWTGERTTWLAHQKLFLEIIQRDCTRLFNEDG